MRRANPMKLRPLCRLGQVSRAGFYRWRRELREFGAKAFSGPGRNRADENRIAALERKVGQQVVEIDFLRGCLQHVEEQRRLQALTTRNSSTPTSKSK